MLDFLESQGSLEEFLKRHVKPYDPAADDYDRPPFAADIKEGKNDSIYNAHSYHTKVPPRSIIPYILHYTKPGDLVLDLFCGSGMTGVATQMCANPPGDILEHFPELKNRVGPRVCILNDLSPAACHIAFNYNTPVDVNALKKEFERILPAVKEEFDWLYGTEHYEPAIGYYAITNPEVLTRLRNPPPASQKDPTPSTSLLEEDTEVPKTLILLSRSDVEQRLGCPVSDLPRDQSWKNLDVSQIEEWICIPATIQYTIWSDVYRCEGFVTIEEQSAKNATEPGRKSGSAVKNKKRAARGCGKEIVLRYASLVHGHDDRQGSTFICPHCKTPWQKSPLPWVRTEPVECLCEWNGLDGKRHKQLRQMMPKEKELAFSTPLSGEWFPDDNLYANRELLTMGAGKKNIKRLSDFYYPRQLRALSHLFAEISSIHDSRTKSVAMFCFTAIVLKCSRLNRLRPSGAGDPLTGTLYIGSLVREDNVRELWIRRTEAILSLYMKISPSGICVRQGDAAHLSGIPPDSVDFIFADPPFGGNIFYADASMLWEGWIRSFTDVRAEMVIHRRSKTARHADGYVFKELTDYARDMRSAFNEMHRVLKPGRWAVVEFNNSDGAVFEAIKGAATDAGFQIASMLLLDKKQRSFKQAQGVLGKEDVVDKDVLFNLYKPAVSRAYATGDDRDIQEQVVEAVLQHLRSLPDRIKTEPVKYSDDHRTTATINSMLMNTLIPRGVSVESLNLPYIERVCSRYFRKIGQHWYLRGEAVTNGNGGGLIQEEIAVKDEVSAIEWLRQKVQARPLLVGELKPLWMRATGLLAAEVSQQLDLEVLLRENFWKDAESNRWREPTAEERELMNDSQTLRVLHDAERFLAGSLKRQVSDTDRCEWIEAIFRACRAVEEQEGEELPALRDFDSVAGYRMISQLFHGVLSDHVPAAVFGRVEKQAHVASSRLREGIESDKTGKKARESKNQLELEL